MLVSCLAACAACLGMGSAFSQERPEPGYTLTEIGSLGGPATYGYAINFKGQITGASCTSGVHSRCPTVTAASVLGTHAFLYDNGTMRDLGTLTDGVSSLGYGINGKGQVTGLSVGGTTTFFNTFLFSAGSMHEVRTLAASESQGQAINDAGQVAGYASATADGPSHAFLYGHGIVQDLGTFGGTTSAAYGINAGSQVTGSANLSGDAVTHAFLYSSGSMQDLGTLGGPNSTGFAVNETGQVTGVSNVGGITVDHAFLYADGAMKDLGVLIHQGCSQGEAINSRGIIVGRAAAAPSCEAYEDQFLPFIYRNGTMTDLNTLISKADAAKYALYDAVAMNDSGQIVVNGSLKTQLEFVRAFLLTPVGKRD